MWSYIISRFEFQGIWNSWSITFNGVNLTFFISEQKYQEISNYSWRCLDRINLFLICPINKNSPFGIIDFPCRLSTSPGDMICNFFWIFFISDGLLDNSHAWSCRRPGFLCKNLPWSCSSRFGLIGRVIGDDINRLSSSGNHVLLGLKGAINTTLHWAVLILFITEGMRWKGGNA